MVNVFFLSVVNSHNVPLKLTMMIKIYILKKEAWLYIVDLKSEGMRTKNWLFAIPQWYFSECLHFACELLLLTDQLLLAHGIRHFFQWYVRFLTLWQWVGHLFTKPYNSRVLKSAGWEKRILWNTAEVSAAQWQWMLRTWSIFGKFFFQVFI